VRRRRVTLTEVANAAGLSITQVSRALAGYDDVAESTRARVQLLAQKLGYRPSMRARNLAMGGQSTKRCTVVGVDLPISGLYASPYGPVSIGILAGAAATGMDVQLTMIASKSPAEELSRLAAEDSADGVLVLTFAALEPRDVAPLEAAGIPYVLVNRHFGHSPGAAAVNSVTPDWVQGTRDAVHRLNRLGHRRLAALLARGGTPTSTTLDHEQGWRMGLADYGIDESAAPIVEASLGIGDWGGYEVGRLLLTEGLPTTGERPTAIVAYNDTQAQGVLRAARELGVDVPGELSVLGFDNSIGEYLWPPLCSFDPHFYQVGEQSALVLAALMAGDDGAEGLGLRTMIPLDYVCRATCAPPP
jgi:LacI family transcriptional regulator